VAATILPAPATVVAPRVTMRVDDRGFAVLRVAIAPGNVAHSVVPFVRVTKFGVQDTDEAFAKMAGESATTIPLTGESRELQVRIERLIVAGT